MFIMDPSLESIMVETHFVEQQSQLVFAFVIFEQKQIVS